MAITSVTTPLLNNNDDFVRVVEWHVKPGARVSRGQLLVTLETVKASMDLEAEADGFLRWSAAFADDMAPVGAVLAVFTDGVDEPFDVPAKAEAKPALAKGNGEAGAQPLTARRVTAKARARAMQLGVDIDRIETPNGDTITEQVVEAFAKQFKSPPHSQAAPTSSKASAADHASQIAADGMSAIIIGDGAHARYMFDTIQRSGACRVVGCTSAARPRGDIVGGMTVVGSDDDLPALFASGVRLAVVGVGSSRAKTRSNDLRRRLFERLKEIGFFLPVIVDPDASLSASATLGEGTVVGAGAIVSAHAAVGRNCVINVGTIVCHDCVIEDHVHLTPGAVLAGSVFVGASSTIGMNASILDGTRIGRNCLVPNGYRVIKDLPDNSVAPSL